MQYNALEMLHNLLGPIGVSIGRLLWRITLSSFALKSSKDATQKAITVIWHHKGVEGALFNRDGVFACRLS